MDFKKLSDAALFSLLKKGDTLAYTEIYQRYSPPLYAHVLKYLNDREEAQDTIQELFAYLWAQREEVNIHTQLSSYLYRATRNRVLNILSHRDVANQYIDTFQKTINTDYSDYLIRENQLAELIEKEISFLPSKMKKVFLLSRKEYLSHKEIAEELQISELTVKKQVANAIKVLRIKLNPYLRCFIIFF